MIDRAREITQMMGYTSIDATLEAIGNGELILLKLPENTRNEIAGWLRAQLPTLRSADEKLAESLEELASGLELALELQRYPAEADVCNLDLPHGWPSYCEKEKL